MDNVNTETIPINLWIGGRSYRIRINKDDEEKVRFAVKVADDRIAEFKNMFAGRDDQDFIAMCLLMYATDQAVDVDALTTVQKDRLNAMIHKIDATLGTVEKKNDAKK